MSNYITYEERMEVENCLFNGKSFGEIAKVLCATCSLVLFTALKKILQSSPIFSATAVSTPHGFTLSQQVMSIADEWKICG